MKLRAGPLALLWDAPVTVYILMYSTSAPAKMEAGSRKIADNLGFREKINSLREKKVTNFHAVF